MSIRLVGYSKFQDAHPPRPIDPQTREDEDRGMEALGYGLALVGLLTLLAVLVVWIRL